MRKIGFIILIAGLAIAVGCGGSSSTSNNSTIPVGPTNPTNPTNPAVAECIQFLDNSYFWGSVKLADVRIGGTLGLPAGGTPVVNVAPLVVDAGPVSATNPQVNVSFVTVQVCAPGTSTCVTLDHVAVDTGSTGLRIPAELLTSLSLPNVYSNTTPTSTGGTNDGSEFAGSVPIMVMGDTSIPSAPSSCSTVTTISGAQQTGTVENTVAQLGAKGLIGVGNYQYDCDVPGAPLASGFGTFGIGSSNPCSPSSSNTTAIPGTYYTCSSSSCTEALVSGPQQVQNPVALFTDNNGVIMQLPSVQTGVGALNASGSLVFGIGTQNGALNNNGLGSAIVLPLDQTYADDAWLGITTQFGTNYYPPLGIYTVTNYAGSASFFDSGSNGIYFLDQPTLRTAGFGAIVDCTSTDSTGWYCPSSTASLTAATQAISNGTLGNSTPASFSVTSASTLFTNNPTFTAFSDLAGPNSPGSRLNSSTRLADEYFDWGLPFFYGKSVYTAIWGVTPPSGSGVPAGPFWAY
jgi:hypothetical protein